MSKIWRGIKKQVWVNIFERADLRVFEDAVFKRGEEKDAWPFQQIERCQQAFKSDLYDKKIHTDMIEIEEIVDIIIETIELGEAK